MSQTKIAALLLIAFGVLAGCQGDSYWRAKQSAEINSMDRDPAVRDRDINRDGDFMRMRSAYDPRDYTSGFSQDNYWGGSETSRDVYAYPRDTTYPRDTYTYPRDTYPRDTTPRTTPRDPNLRY